MVWWGNGGGQGIMLSMSVCSIWKKLILLKYHNYAVYISSLIIFYQLLKSVFVINLMVVDPGPADGGTGGDQPGPSGSTWYKGKLLYFAKKPTSGMPTPEIRLDLFVIINSAFILCDTECCSDTAVFVYTCNVNQDCFYVTLFCSQTGKHSHVHIT